MRFVNAHITDIPPERERFDTLVSPSGTVATLNEIARINGIPHIGFDSAFPGPVDVSDAIRNEVEATLTNGGQPVLLCTTLIYNAEAVLSEAKKLKDEFGDRVKIVLGGQLVPFATQAYSSNPNIDAVCTGDAEVIIPELRRDIEARNLKRIYSKWLRMGDQKGRFAFVNYDHFFGLKERMGQQRKVSGFSQLCIQGLGGPGCSWAAGNKNGACDFCALQNIAEMNTQSLETQMTVERNLQKKFSPDRFFDVANQFLPFIHPRENIAWLKKYIEVRNRFGITTPKYAYLTVASINEEIAELLKQAGIVEVYLGVDHFDEEALAEENKSHRTQKRLEMTLNALRNNGIMARMGLVVGSSRENKRTLKRLEEGVRWLSENYSGMVRTLGIFPIYVLPGSKVYEKIKKMPAAREIIDRFERCGFMSKEDEEDLTRIYMREHSEASPEEIYTTILALEEMATKFTIAHNYNCSPGAEVLKR